MTILNLDQIFEHSRSAGREAANEERKRRILG
jgi:hypothetical protein